MRLHERIFTKAAVLDALALDPDLVLAPVVVQEKRSVCMTGYGSDFLKISLILRRRARNQKNLKKLKKIKKKRNTRRGNVCPRCVLLSFSLVVRDITDCASNDWLFAVQISRKNIRRRRRKERSKVPRVHCSNNFILDGHNDIISWMHWYNFNIPFMLRRRSTVSLYNN